MENTHNTGAGLLLAGRYRLSETIGRGGMGKVWRAHDEVLHRVVAVKELTAGLYVSEADRTVLHARTQKEARAAARISHPGVVTVHDVLEHDARPWIVMQYVDGPSLADAAKERGRVDEREAARIGLHILGALRAAHAAGVLHRDIKPANVLLGSDGRALITDFGIAAIEGDPTITRTGEIVGSIDYLAPERVRGHDPGPASDLWSLGATLYTALEGQSPFRRSSPLATMQAVVDDEPAPPRSAGRLEPVIRALLHKDPAARPSAAEAERMLVQAMEDRLPAPAPTTRVPAQRATQRVTQHLPRGGAPDSRTATAAAGSHAVPSGDWAAAPARPRRGPRLRTLAVVVVVAAVIGGGAGLAAMKYAQSGGTTNAGTGTDSRATAPGKASDVPDGWERVDDPRGFSLWVPKGWKRQADGDQIDYTPDNGRHRIRISVDLSPDFENPYMHMLEMQEGLKKRLPDYRRVKLRPNTFRDQTQSALWEFSWTERTEHPGPRRAIDQMYYEDDGTEYALYMSGPAKDWAVTREQFDTMLRGWRPPPN
ncbi:protein kinase [Streptomyces sp. ISL-10]|uniref:serine/threonine-protein kinase n=1 Tax=Streptomyces sp. ISL-10 TaxID=2819172 RepID=UPI001BEBF1E9|nr:serine/threonine-protein kinase [Streptomyces sp. ISL-10]MBT2367838.1 protein kinase [Streptomyces sp. ISL-10]